MSEAWLAESDRLHERVQRFVAGKDVDTFEQLALAIAQFQARHHAGFRRLVEARGASLESLASIPAVTTDAFRLTRVAVHPPELDAACFTTSGTTGQARGRHPMRRTDTYRKIALAWGRKALLDDGSRRIVLALAKAPATPADSSLGFMMQAFMEELDGRALTLDPTGAAFDVRAPARWLLTEGGIDLDGLERATRIAYERNEPLLILATSYALVLLLDALAGEKLRCSKRTVVMQTGGFKGRVREVEGSELRAAVARCFGIDPQQVVGEYGMTELTSQLYEATVPGASLRGVPGLYVPPPWLRVDAVDPETRQVTSGEGLARFVDLGNVDSAIAVVTQDLIRCHQRGVELLGRRRGAPLRGCSLAAEEIVIGGG